MEGHQLVEHIEQHLGALTTHPDRHVGGLGNLEATRYFAERCAAYGLDMDVHEFDCLEWQPGDARVIVGDVTVAAHAGPYSHPFGGTLRLFAASAVEEIEGARLDGAVLLLHGDIAAHQLMPKNFTFYNPESHRRIIRAIEEARPAAVIAATGTDPEMVGAQYPFPLFEDGDFDIPNAYLKDTDGEVLRAHAGEPVDLLIESERLPARGEHVIATRRGTGSGRIVLSAHIDSRRGSPGGLDNASGVATLLGVAELTAGYEGSATLEFMPFNGEDDYANPGEMLWMAQNAGRFDEVELNINVDDSSQRGHVNHVSFYGCPPRTEAVVRAAMADRAQIAEGPQWQQGDHMIFVMQGRPAIAIASSAMGEFMARYAHTERDTVDLADPLLVAETGRFITDIVRALG